MTKETLGVLIFSPIILTALWSAIRANLYKFIRRNITVMKGKS